MKKTKLEKLASEGSNPCVTISMTTHRTHPDNEQDIIALHNLLKEAKERVINEFDNRTVTSLLEKLDSVDKEIDVNYLSDSLHLFLSNSTKEIVKSPWQVTKNSVHITESLSIKPLIEVFNRTEEYLILLLSQSGVKLYHATNDTLAEEMKNHDFPLSHHEKQVDNMGDEFLNKIDKAVVKVCNKTDMNCVVICTENNYSRLLKVADKPSIYYGCAGVNTHDSSHHTLATHAWKIITALQKKHRTEAIGEMQEAVDKAKS